MRLGAVAAVTAVSLLIAEAQVDAGAVEQLMARMKAVVFLPLALGHLVKDTQVVLAILVATTGLLLLVVVVLALLAKVAHPTLVETVALVLPAQLLDRALQEP